MAEKIGQKARRKQFGVTLAMPWDIDTQPGVSTMNLNFRLPKLAFTVAALLFICPNSLLAQSGHKIIRERPGLNANPARQRLFDQIDRRIQQQQEQEQQRRNAQAEDRALQALILQQQLNERQRLNAALIRRQFGENPNGSNVASAPAGNGQGASQASTGGQELFFADRMNPRPSFKLPKPAPKPVRKLPPQRIVSPFVNSATVVVTNPEAAKSQTDAEKYYRENKFEQAAAAVDSAISVDFDNGYLHLFASYIDLANQEYSSAAAELELATRLLRARDWDFLMKKVDELVNLPTLDAQIQQLSNHCENNPQDNSARIVRAFHKGLVGKYETTWRDLEAVLATNPNHTTARRIKKELEAYEQSRQAVRNQSTKTKKNIPNKRYPLYDVFSANY